MAQSADPPEHAQVTGLDHSHRGGARLVRAAGVVGLATMSSRILGLVRDLVLAYLFGASNEMDAYTVAFRIPNLLRDLFAEGALGSAFVPTFTRVLTIDGKAAAWRLGNLVITALLLATGVLALLGMVFAWPLVTFAAGRYASVPGKLELAVTLARIMLPFLTLIAVAVGLMGMLNSLRRFFVPAFSPAMFNIGTLVTMAVLVPVFRAHGIRAIFAVAIGTLVGGIGQVVIQWPDLRREGFRFRPRIDFGDPGLREVLTLMGPGTMALAAVQINILINTMLATSQGEGAVSCLNFAFRVMYLPIGLFGLSIATAAIPSLSQDAARGDPRGMGATFSSALRMMLVLNVPATVGLMVLSTPIVALLFEHGSFTAEAAAGTAAALMFYAPGLIGYSAIKLAVPTFYTLRDSRTPVIVGAVSVAFNIALSLLLVRLLGFQGLALGTSVSSIFNAAVLLWLLRRRLGAIDGRRIGLAFAKVALAAVVMAAAAWSGERWLEFLVPGHSTLARLVHVFGGIGLGLAGLAAASRALRIAEFDEALAAVRTRLFPPKTA
jgi:putative peptidoglycan lipid II flippase